jgi:hypothetical protein
LNVSNFRAEGNYRREHWIRSEPQSVLLEPGLLGTDSPCEGFVKRLFLLCCGVLVLFGNPVFARSTSITMYTDSHEAFTAYVAGPKDASKAVVLVHDWFGVSAFYTEAADRL